MTTLKYALALIAAQVAGLLGVLVTAALTRRLELFVGQQTKSYLEGKLK